MVINKNVDHHNYKTEIPVRYLADNKTTLFNQFPFKNELSKSTFFKYLNKNGQFKNPHRLIIILN